MDQISFIKFNIEYILIQYLFWIENITVFNYKLDQLRKNIYNNYNMKRSTN
jgi:hypothetical protein